MPHPDMSANGGHPDEGLLHEWLDDQLSPSDAADVQRHVASCAECGARVAEARGLIAASHRILSALDEIPAGVIPTNMAAASVSQPDIVSPAANENSITKSVVSIEDARAIAGSAQTKRAFRWQRLAPIAAVLLVAVAVARVSTMNDDVTTTMAANETPSAPGARDVAAPAAANAGVGDARALASRPDAQRVASQLKKAVPASDAMAEAKKTIASVKPEQGASTAAGARSDAITSPEKERMAREMASAQARLQPSTSAVSAGSPVIAPATPPTVVADQTALRADAAAGGAVAGGRGARGGGGGRGGGDRGASAPPVTADRTQVMNAAPPGSVAGTSVIGAAAGALPIGTPVATAPITNAPVAPPALRDSTTRRAETETASRTLVQSKRIDTTAAAQAAATSESANRLVSGGNAMLGLASALVPVFDSVTLVRTTCAPACESTTLHVNISGIVRYLVGSGNTQRVVMSQLTTDERSQLQAMLLLNFPNVRLRAPRTTCSVSVSDRRGPANAPVLQLFVDYPGSTMLRPEQPCTKTETELREIAARMDAIARTDELKRKVPPTE